MIDEDTSATNFMIRDERMQALVAKGDEPITPLVDRIGQLRDELGISTLIVMGGSGDYLDIADTVIQMHDYQAIDVTAKAQQVIQQHPTLRRNECETPLTAFPPRSLNRSVLQKYWQRVNLEYRLKAPVHYALVKNLLISRHWNS